LNTSTNSSSPADLGNEHVQPAGIPARLHRSFLRETAQRRQVSLVRAIGSQLAGELLQNDPGLEDLVQRCVDAVQVEHDGVAHRADRRFRDDQPAPRTAPGARHLLMLHQAHRLPEDGTAHVIALEQISLGPEDVPHRPTQRHHVFHHSVGYLGRPLGV
jgi:hypothetical protein